MAVADVAWHIMVVADAEGRLLWREGNPAVQRKADRLGFDSARLGRGGGRHQRRRHPGAGPPAGAGLLRRALRPLAIHPWTCAGAPITDPRDGRLLGVVNVSGPLDTMHPATLAWVDSVAKLAEAGCGSSI